MIITALAVIAILQCLLTLLDGIRSARHMRSFRTKPRDTRERIAVFCPCKGIDPEFEKNIRSILDQDYANYDVTFIVESSDDLAYGALRSIGAKNILIAGRAVDCGQKVHNLAHAVTHIRESPDIYVFCDSDARFPRNWLSKLVAALETSNITTGYRWYVARRAHLPTLMRSGWNASSAGVLGDHNRNFAWGGSTAIYRETFNRLKILEAWRGSVSDDYSITNAAHRAGTKIIFVPECLVPTYGECTWREVFEFTTRQIVITRVYHARLWRVAFVGHAIFNAAFFVLPWYHPFLWLMVFALSIAKSWIRYGAVETVLPFEALSKHRWFYILCSPAVALLFLYNMISSAVATDIVWRQIHYKLISPNETRVFGGSAASES
jgi:cellulose synthase/poly-beta-1,6-N-acetylglucosamine synthase-like glycosyltransferase